MMNLLSVYPMTNSIIQVDSLHKSYLMGKEAVPALRGVTIDVQRKQAQATVVKMPFFNPERKTSYGQV